MQTKQTASRPPAKLPEWDRLAVAKPYLIELREQAAGGGFDPVQLDQLLTALVTDLRAVYVQPDVDRAIAGLERVFANIDRQAADARSALAQEKIPLPPNLVPSLKTQRNASPPTPKVVQPAKPQPAQRAQSPTKAPSPVNGDALRKSILPTLVALIGFSWVSLVWGGLISLPFGIGAGVFGTLIGGLIAVPLWGTVFGFMGMSRAHTSTLKSMGFQELPRSDPLVATAAAYATQLGIPTPQLGTIPVHNAFAMGSTVSDATVAIGKPLRTALTPDEVNAVLAHELGHVVSGDMRRMMLMRTFQNATVWYMMFNGAKQLARWVICWAAELSILKFSRNREYWADAIGAALAGKEAMIGALRKLDQAPALSAEENTHARFMVRGRVRGFFSTHPSIEQRIAALEYETHLERVPRR